MIDSAQILRYLLDILDIPPDRLSPDNEEAWRKVLSLAAEERIFYSLSGLILEQRSPVPPPAVREEMRRELSANFARSALLCLEISSLARLFREADVPLLFLKGASNLVRGIYPPGWRFMGDLDILVPEERASRASALLAEEGYAPAPDAVGQVHHQPQLFHPNRVGRIDLHTALFQIGLRAGRTLPEIWGRAETVTFRGEPVRVPNLTDQVWILIYGDIIRRVTIPRLYDVVEYCLLVEWGGRVDFGEIARRAEENGAPHLLSAFSRACVRFGGMESFAEGDEPHVRLWEGWSREVQRKDLGSGMFYSARRRFTAIWFLSGSGRRSKIGFGLRLMKEIAETDRFEPGPYRKRKLAVRIYEWMKMLLALLPPAFQYGAFQWRNRRKR